jgi:nucleoside-diphosphate-sugar epimerase
MTYKNLGVPKIFYSSSACMYPEHNQLDPNNPNCEESSAYPANPDSEYGWEKLFSERLYLAFARNYKFDVRIARFHNIFGPYGSWNNGKEKAPAAICRKVAQAANGGEIEIWGDGTPIREFIFANDIPKIVEIILLNNFRFDEMILAPNVNHSINDIVKILIIVLFYFKIYI